MRALNPCREFVAMMSSCAIRATSMLGALSIGIGSVLAQPHEGHAQLIMSMPRSSMSIRDSLRRHLYEAIKKRSGRTASQSLPLTRTEVWSVPQENVEAVRKAAAQYGVIAYKLGADWNHVFRSMPADVRMNAEQKAMIAQAKSSKATIGVGMMLPLRAATVEYALTKGAGAQATSNEPAKIRLQLNEKMILTITRTSVEIKSDMCVWRGSVDGTNAPATIMWWPGVAMAGTVQHGGRIYSIKRMFRRHAIAVVEMSESRMPPEHEPMTSRLRFNDPNLRDDPLVHQGDASMLRSSIARVASPSAQRSRAEDQYRQPTATRAEEPAKQMAETADPSDITINVIVAFTKAVASHYTDVGRELVEFAMEQSNRSFRESNLGYVKLRLVHAYQTDYAEYGDHFDHLWRFADKDDGYMDEIHGLRDKYDADVAVLIVDDAKGCGLSTRVFADADEAFSVVHHECAALTYTVAHEIGHLIGARHELAIDSTMTPFPYGHGHVNGTKWRDIMSYKESCGGCPRLPIWSSPKLMIQGEPAGTAHEDNARVIAEQAARVANFRASRRDSRTYIAAPIPREPGTGAADAR